MDQESGSGRQRAVAALFQSISVGVTFISRLANSVPGMNRTRRLLSSLLTLPLLVVLLGTALFTGTALATATPTWSSISDLPSYVPNMNGASVASGPSGSTLVLAGITPLSFETYGNVGVWPVTAGSALPLQSDIYGEFDSTKAEFLPNGDSILSAYDPEDYYTTLAYRFANGTYGGEISVYGLSSYAANDDELLVTSAGAGASVTSYSIGTGGSLTANGSPVQIFTDGTLFGETWTAIDPSGSAEVMINATDEQAGTPDYGDGYMAEVSRSASGVWASPEQVPGTAQADTNSLQVAVAPTGRMLATWPVDIEVNSQFYTIGVDASIREPGGNFGTPVQLLDQSSVPVGGIAEALDPKIAAGPDGTLATTVTSDTCANQQLTSDQSSSTTVWIAPPGGQLTPYSVPGTTLTSSFSTTVTALAAGGGRAIIGLDTTDVINPTNIGGGSAWNEASCGEQEGYPTQTTLTDSAVILGPNVQVTSPAWGTGGQTGTGPVTEVGVDGAALDAAGNATVIGDLNTSDPSEYATYGSVGGALTPPASGTGSGSGGTGSGGSGSGAGSTGGSGGSAATGTATPAAAGSTTTATQLTAPKQKPATITLVTPTIIGQNGGETIGFGNTSSANEHLGIALLAVESGLTKSLAVHGRAVTRLVRIASGSLTLKPHHSGKLTLHLSRAARKALAKSGHLTVALVITTKATGHATTVVTRHLTLRLRRA